MTHTRSLELTIAGQNEVPEAELAGNTLVTVLMPCLNESRTLASCIRQAHLGCQAAMAQQFNSQHWPTDGDADTTEFVTPSGESSQGYEIIVADNGSNDGSQEIALASGARVAHVEQKGYGAAILGGIAAAKGKYIVMGDSDSSYDFGEVPSFVAKLEEGFDLVIGNRFAGSIMPGAMPWHHRYIGNPVLSGIGRLLYQTSCRDWHCGLRGFDRIKISALQLRCPGMEFASEIIIKAVQKNLRISEIDIRLMRDGRDRPPHLRSIRDGCRHLKQLLTSLLIS